MGITSISWTDRSVNPIRARLNGHVGHHCEKVSAGCANCYASRLQSRFKMPKYRADQRRDVEVFFDDARLREVLTRRKPTKWFWCDMTDLFGEWVEDAWIDKIFAVCALTPQHTHQILTKRPERMREYIDGLSQDDAHRWHAITPPGGDNELWPLPNVHIGVSVEDQATADQRIPILLQTLAAVRWVSYEPALGPVDLSEWMEYAEPGERFYAAQERGDALEALHILRHGEPALDWVVVGGESGPNARPCDVAWISSAVEQCRVVSVPVFVKQDSGPRPGLQGRLPDDLWVKEFPVVSR